MTELRLLMGPITTATNDGHGIRVVVGSQYRWVTENGHPGGCGEDCWHASELAALRCFERGRRR